MKRILSLTIAILMTLACMPIVMAESEFEYENYEDGIAITGYNGPGGVVTIPAEIDGKKVVAIDKIKDRNDITKLILPEGLTELCGESLTKMSSLKEIILPSTLNIIGFEALAFTGIESVNIPESVTEIRGGAFNGSKLTSIHIPKNAKLNGSIVAYCKSLKKITVDSSNPYYAADGKYLYSKNEGTAVDYAGGITDKRITIPSYIKNIMHYCFIQNQYIETVITHKNLVKIYYWTFFDCPNLKEVYVTGENTIVSNDITNNPNLVVYTNGKIDGFADGPKDTSDEFIVKPYIEGMENPSTPTTEKAKETTTKPVTTTKPSSSKTENETVVDSTTETTTETTILESDTLKETEVNAIVDNENIETTGDEKKNNATPIIVGVVAVVVIGGVATGVAITLKKKKK